MKSDKVKRFALADLPFLSQLEGIEKKELGGNSPSANTFLLSSIVKLVIFGLFLFPISNEIRASDLAIVLTEAHTDVTCSGYSDGSIDLTISGGLAPFIIDWDNDGVGDNDDSEDISALSPGDYTVVVTDALLEVKSLTVTIIEILDVTPPVPDLPSLIDVSAECSVSLSAPTAIDNCDGAIVGTTTDPTSYAIQGTYTVTWVYEDGNGNTSIQTQDVIIDDITAPVPDVTSLPAITEECSAILIPPTATDNCEGVILATTTDPVIYAIQGIYSVTWTYDDGNGNTASQDQTVIIDDVTFPTAICQPTTIDLGTGTVVLDSTLIDGGTTDNCTGWSIAASPNVFTAIGDYSATLTVTDIGGNPDECIATVTVEDTSPPVCASLDTTLYLDVSGMVGINSVDIDNGSTDNGIIASYLAADTIFACTDVNIPTAPNFITLTVTDNAGNQSSCISEVTVLDTISPIVFCQDIIVDLDSNGLYTLDPVLLDFGSSDLCGIDTLYTDISLFDCDDAGLNISVTLTAEDPSGNSSSCIAQVTVQDNILPVMTCNAAITVNNDPGLCGAVVNYSIPGVTDNCSTTITALSGSGHDPGDFFPVGTTWVGYYASNPSNGATVTCWFPITVHDNESPVLTCPLNDTVPANSSCQSILGDYTSELFATDNCTSASSLNVVQSPAPGSVFSGSANVSFTVTDGQGNTSQCSFVVEVEDDSDPQIDALTCPGDQTVYLDSGCEYTIADYTGVISATDNCTPIISLSIVQSPISGTVMTGHGTSQVLTLTVIDTSGNSSICSFILTAQDTITPQIDCPGDIIQNVDFGLPTGVIIYPVPLGSDNCSGAITVQTDLSGLSSGSAFPVGTTVLEYAVTDIAGLIDTCSFTVTIIDSYDPEVICPDTLDVDAPVGYCDTDIPISVPVPMVTDNDGIVSLINDYTGTGNASAVYPVGLTVVTWTATDNSGNTATCEQYVNVSDVEAPSNLVCPNDTTISATIGECGIDGALIVLNSPTAIDPCNNISITNNAPNYYSVGDTTVTWTVADSSGNALFCYQVVTILDEDLPTPDPATCPPDQSVSVENGECSIASANVSLVGPTATDPCGVFDIYNNAPDTFLVGATTVTWYIEDNSGNIDSACVQLITVIDDEDPVILDCPDPVNVDASLTECGIDSSLVSLGNLTATDPCGIVSISNNAPIYYQVGTTVVTWNVTDSNGNIATCDQSVTVHDIESPSDLTCPNDTIISATIGECGIDGASVDLNSPTAIDPCDTLVIANNAPAYYPVGMTTVTWTIADTSGNSVSCLQVVTITDDELPTPDPASCPSDTTVSVDNGECGTASVNISLIGPTATDPCGIFSITNNAPDTFQVGTTIVTWYIEDNNGNIDSTCTQMITIMDDEDPIILDCPFPIDVDASIGECGIDSALVFLGVLNAFDPCGILSITNDAPAFYSVGLTLVTWTVTDSNGNTTICIQNVSVNDEEAPSNLICPPDTSIVASVNECGIDATLVELTAPMAYEPCGILVITNDAPASYPVDTTMVTWVIADTSGNEVVCTQQVIILDQESPVMTVCPNDTIIDNDLDQCGAIYSYPLPVALDNCGIAEIIKTQGLDSGEFFPIGSNYIEYQISDIYGNVTICAFTVIVQDTQFPQFLETVIVTFQQVEGECESVVTFNIPQATDNCPGVITSQIDGSGLTTGDIFPVGSTILTYQGVDAAGNITYNDIEINVLDTESPVVLNCPVDMMLNSELGLCGATSPLNPPVAIDNCGSVTMIHDAPAIFPIGSTAITWTISDQAGNTQICTLEMIVTDNEAPVIECPSDVVLEADWGDCESEVIIEPMIASDNCAINVIVNDFNGTDSASGTYPLGVTVVTWTVTDVNGNETVCQTIVTVNISGSPIIDCAEDISVENDSDVCGAYILVPAPLMEYECGILEVSNDFNNSVDGDGQYPIGTTLVTWTVLDVSGNSSQCSTSVTVIDSQEPTITCLEDVSVPNDAGLCGAYIDYDIPEVWDNCGIEALTLMEGLEPGSFFNDGTTEVLYQVTDINGNSAICSFEVTVIDEEAPLIICPPDMLVIDSIVNYPYPEYSDNCYAELILINGPDSAEVFDHGYTDVHFAAVDLYGNMDTCEFQVLVNEPPVAVNDTIVIFESDDEITVEIMDNDYDLDGDSIWVTDILYGNHLGYTDGTVIWYNIPDNECGIDSVAYILQDEYGATDTAIVFVEIECFPSIFVPDGFSPNGDGVNDELHILGLYEFPENNLQVFNRWGHKVYDKSDYQNDWDGKSEAALTIGNTYLPRGTYFYILDIGTNNIKPLKGFFYINPR